MVDRPRRSARLAVLGAALLACVFGPRARADSRVAVILPASTSWVGDSLEPLAVESTRLATLDASQRLVRGPLSRAEALRLGRCAALDLRCLEGLAVRLGADRILVLDAAASETERTLHAQLYDRYTTAMRTSMIGVAEGSTTSPRELSRLLEKLVPFALRLPEEGGVLVRAVGGSTVYVDNRPMGQVGANGELSLSRVRVGRHVLRVVRPSGLTFEAPILVRARAGIEVTVDAGAAIASLDAQRDPSAHAADHVEPPPSWVFAVPGLPAEPDAEATMFDATGTIPFAQIRIPLLEEHVMRGEIRTSTEARLGFLPNVSGSGARVTAKLRF